LFAVKIRLECNRHVNLPFGSTREDDQSVVVGSYDYALVALSVVIAVVGSYAALDLVERIGASRRRARTAWLSEVP
jgi:hypothetical protein